MKETELLLFLEKIEQYLEDVQIVVEHLRHACGSKDIATALVNKQLKPNGVLMRSISYRFRGKVRAIFPDKRLVEFDPWHPNYFSPSLLRFYNNDHKDNFSFEYYYPRLANILEELEQLGYVQAMDSTVKMYEMTEAGTAVLKDKISRK